jgi:hypothetical protein
MWRKPPVSANRVFQGLGRPEPDGFMGLDGHGFTSFAVFLAKPVSWASFSTNSVLVMSFSFWFFGIILKMAASFKL